MSQARRPRSTPQTRTSKFASGGRTVTARSGTRPPPPPPSRSPHRRTAQQPQPRASVGPRTATWTSSPSPAARWMAPSLHLIASVEQSLVGLPLPPPINRSFLRWFPSRWVSALTTTTARTLPTESLLVTNSCLVKHPSCLIVPYREHIFGQNNLNSSSQLVSLLLIRTFDIRRIPISCKLPL